MPGFAGSLTAQQRWNVLAYVYSLSQPADALVQGKTLYESKCSSCHGSDGKTVASANLADASLQSKQTAADLFQAITVGKLSQMPAFTTELSDGQRWAVVAYLRTFAYLNAPQDLALAVTSTPSGTTTTPAAIVNAPTSSNQPLVDITGQVSNGSGGSIPNDLVITLHGYDNLQETLTQTAQVSSTGEYRFTQVPYPTGRVFLVSTTYKANTFSSDISPTTQSAGAPVSLPITIYDTTTDKSALQIDRMHVFFDFSRAGIAQVVELIVASNSGKLAIAPASPDQAVLTYILPSGATNLQFQDGSLGQRYIQTSDGFSDTQSIAPGNGSYQLLFAFDLPYSEKLDLVLPISYPVQSAVIMLPKGGIQAVSSQLQDSGDRDIQGTTFHLYSAEALTPDHPLSLTLTGKPTNSSQASLFSGTSPASLLVGIAALGMALSFATFWVLRKRQNLRNIPATNQQTQGEVLDSADPDTLVDAILALDDMYQSGNLPADAYHQRRTELKQRLADKVEKG